MGADAPERECPLPFHCAPSFPLHTLAPAAPSELPGRSVAPAHCPRGYRSAASELLDERPLLPLLACRLPEGEHIMVIHLILRRVAAVLVIGFRT